jgi:hypothetical protein
LKSKKSDCEIANWNDNINAVCGLYTSSDRKIASSNIASSSDRKIALDERDCKLVDNG